MYKFRIALGVFVFILAALVARAENQSDQQTDSVIRPIMQACYDQIVEDMMLEHDLRLNEFVVFPNPSKVTDLSKYKHTDKDGDSVFMFKANLGLGRQPIFYSFYIGNDGFPRCEAQEKGPTIH